MKVLHRVQEGVLQCLQRNKLDSSWKGPEQYQDKETRQLMMLPTDMWLVWDKCASCNPHAGPAT